TRSGGPPEVGLPRSLARLGGCGSKALATWATGCSAPVTRSRGLAYRRKSAVPRAISFGGRVSAERSLAFSAPPTSPRPASRKSLGVPSKGTPLAARKRATCSRKALSSPEAHSNRLNQLKKPSPAKATPRAFHDLSLAEARALGKVWLWSVKCCSTASATF